MASSSSRYLLLALCLAALQLASLASVQGELRTDGLCVNGTKHKTRPSPEGSDYAECHNYKQSSCCTANFTKVLAQATVTHIENFHWGRCGNLSKACEDFMIHVECFYRCSPNAVHWEGEFSSSITGVPICSGFCDDWFAACRREMSCATNWIFDYNTTASGENYCSTDSTCMTWEQRYGNATSMCNTLWGTSFKYTSDTANCIQLNGTNLLMRNTEVVNRLFSSGSTPLPLPVAVLLAVLALALLA
eukprot:scpid90446/ scgid14074/ Riboflavin-binding protein; Riboflavin-binding protein, plasma form; Riboflavin-binding protein, yolk major form; Riboflavin-binding protein, yolk minor form